MDQPPELTERTPRVFSAEEISAIPPDLRRDLNIVAADETPTLMLDEPGGFSWAALVYGPFYYVAMKDWLFMVLSAVASLLVYTIPILIPLAFFARRRAWELKDWRSPEQFRQVQRSWDRSAIIGVILMAALAYFASRYIYSTLSSAFGTTDPNAVLQQVQGLYQ